MQTETSDTIRVLVFREDEMWLAQCIEYDIGAQAADLSTLQRRFNATLSAEIDESVTRFGTAFQGISKPPACYQSMWAAAESNFSAREKTGVTPTKSPHVEYEMALCA